MGKEHKEGSVQPEFKQSVHWLEEGERFLADASWSEDKALSSVIQAFMGNQSLRF